jgi:hypothetical protein
MMAEIFMLRLEAATRAAKEAATTSSRFVHHHLAGCEGVLTQAAGNGPGLVITPTAPERSP